MAISYDLEIGHRIVRIRVVDPIDLKQIQSVVDELMRDTRLRGFDILSDHSELRDVASTTLVKGVIPVLRTLAQGLGVGRCAVVVSQDASYGMARMAALLAESGGIEVRPFRSTSQAEAWLRGDGPSP